MKTIICIASLILSTSFAFETTPKKTDPMTDEVTQAMYRDSSNAIFANKKDLLGIRRFCKEDKTEIFILTNWVVSDEGIVYRYDKDDPVTTLASTSTNNRAIFLREVDSVHIEKMKKSSKLIIRYTQAGGGIVTPEFSLKGFTAKYNSLCKTK